MQGQQRYSQQMRGGGRYMPGMDQDMTPFPRVALDQWMVDVLADLQEVARERGLTEAVNQLSLTTRVVKDEIQRKRIEAASGRRTMHYSGSDYAPPTGAGYRRH